MADNLDKLHKQVFEDQFLQSITFDEDLPETMTSEMYIRIYRKIWATIRHDLYELVQLKKKEIKCNGPLPAKEFGECYNESHKKFEEVRRDIYELLMQEKIPNEGVARKIMQKAYVTYATIAHDSSGGVLKERSRWAE
jgi:hypothetical protein